MCKKKPGPRCHAHQAPKYQAAQEHCEAVEQEYEEALNRAGGDPGEVDSTLKERRSDAYAKRHEARKLYYSTPEARKKLSRETLPAKEKHLQEVEDAYEQDPTPENKKARTSARADVTAHRNLLVDGERRWSQSNADLATHERRAGAMERGDYNEAQYDNADLSRAGSWDSLNSTKWAKGNKSVRREMRIETPTQERVKATADIHIEGHNVGGYRVKAQITAEHGHTESPDSSLSSLPPRPTTLRMSDSRFDYSKPQQQTLKSQRFETFKEAQDYARSLSKNDQIPAHLSRVSRNRALQAHSERVYGVKTKNDLDEHMNRTPEERREVKKRLADERAQQRQAAKA